MASVEICDGKHELKSSWDDGHIWNGRGHICHHSISLSLNFVVSVSLKMIENHVI